MTFQEYMTQALTEAGLTDEQVTSALGKLYANEKLSPKLNALVKTATEEYNTQTGRLKATQEELETNKKWNKQAWEQYSGLKSSYESVLAELEAARNGGLPPTFDEKKYLPRGDFDAAIKDMQSRMVGVIKDGVRLASRHAANYHEELDVDALEKLAVEKNLPLSVAYDEYIKPREEQRRNASFEEKLKAAKEEGAREALSRHKLPTDPIPTETAPVFSKVSKESLPANIDDELMAVWSGAAQK